MAYKAEYIWVDGQRPTAKLRSKTKILDARVDDVPEWGFDGSRPARRPAVMSRPACCSRCIAARPDPRRENEFSCCARS